MWYQCINPGCDTRPFKVTQNDLNYSNGVANCEHCDQQSIPAPGIPAKVMRVKGHGYDFGIIGMALASPNPDEQGILKDAGWAVDWVTIAMAITIGGYLDMGYDPYGWFDANGPIPYDLIKSVHDYLAYNFDKLTPGCTINMELDEDTFRVIGSTEPE